eukprot:TRINITY_DN1269_c0_g1_i7.p1 TRINITY_DN1269_c0_g1~~TRINITY_DN1269_c0_g1_i7.p1  ORF type:complete len:182 (-),score=22.71 TRINITY_DN1269_c0_g1_i7:82-627(-)
MEEFYEKKQNCDFTLNIEGKKLPCHKLILASRNSYFAGVLNSGMSESQKGELDMSGPDQDHGLTASALDHLLRYLYSDKVDKLLDEFDCMYIMRSAGFLSLTKEFGSRHQNLLLHCRRTIGKNLNVKNCLKLLELSVNNEEISKIILKWMANNFATLKQSEEFNQCTSPELIEQIKAFQDE